MLIKLTPQYNPEHEIKYTFGQDLFVAEMDGVTDTFDFSRVSELDPRQIKTILPLNPVVQVVRVNGELRLTLINYIAKTATETEKFPEYVEV